MTKKQAYIIMTLLALLSAVVLLGAALVLQHVAGLPCEGLRTQSSVQAVNGTCRNGNGPSHLPNIPTGILEAAWSLCLAEAY